MPLAGDLPDQRPAPFDVASAIGVSSPRAIFCSRARKSSKITVLTWKMILRGTFAACKETRTMSNDEGIFV